jgi:hypothetical protein
MFSRFQSMIYSHACVIAAKERNRSTLSGLLAMLLLMQSVCSRMQ